VGRSWASSRGPRCKATWSNGNNRDGSCQAFVYRDGLCYSHWYWPRRKQVAARQQGDGRLDEILLDAGCGDDRDRPWLDRLGLLDLCPLYRVLQREVERRGGIEKLEAEMARRLDEIQGEAEV
jgi:hypothetical protein